jgi:hypothetical protein
MEDIKSYWAWVELPDGNKELCWVTKEEVQKAYKAKEYKRTDIEIPEFRFIRWATTFDL